MLRKHIATSLSAGLVSAAALLAGCATETPDTEVDMAQAEVVMPQTGIPLSPGGVEWVGNFRFKSGVTLENGIELCLEEGGELLATRPCSKRQPKQLFSVYKMPDGNYEICKPQPPETWELPSRDGTPNGGKAGYAARCIHAPQGNGSFFWFRYVVLTTTQHSQQLGDFQTTAKAGALRYNPRDQSIQNIPNTSGFLTRNSGGTVILLSNRTTGGSQQWSIF